MGNYMLCETVSLVRIQLTQLPTALFYSIKQRNA